MDTNELKKLIGADCEVIDPRSKKKVFEPGTIKEIKLVVYTSGRSGEIEERLSFNVKLHKLSNGTDMRGNKTVYNRHVKVPQEWIKYDSNLIEQR